MNLESLQVQYKEYRRDMQSFPPASSFYKKLEAQMGTWLKSVKERFGQDMVDRLTEKVDRKKVNKIKGKLIVVCLECRSPVAQRNLAKHMRTAHSKKKKKILLRAPMPKTLVKCPTCSADVFDTRLARHIKRNHD